ncbi:hypothetical protein Bbelb_349930 [Branchiostoma belcheri]|nr:hypothetical protein Bbelb_349930 [Branchiostoma belcheri]
MASLGLGLVTLRSFTAPKVLQQTFIPPAEESTEARMLSAYGIESRRLGSKEDVFLLAIKVMALKRGFGAIKLSLPSAPKKKKDPQKMLNVTANCYFVENEDIYTSFIQLKHDGCVVDTGKKKDVKQCGACGLELPKTKRLCHNKEYLTNLKHAGEAATGYDIFETMILSPTVQYKKEEDRTWGEENRVLNRLERLCDILTPLTRAWAKAKWRQAVVEFKHDEPIKPLPLFELADVLPTDEDRAYMRLEREHQCQSHRLPDADSCGKAVMQGEENVEDAPNFRTDYPESEAERRSWEEFQEDMAVLDSLDRIMDDPGKSGHPTTSQPAQEAKDEPGPLVPGYKAVCNCTMRHRWSGCPRQCGNQGDEREVLSEIIEEDMLHDIRNSKAVSLMTDESTDVSVSKNLITFISFVYRVPVSRQRTTPTWALPCPPLLGAMWTLKPPSLSAALHDPGRPEKFSRKNLHQYSYEVIGGNPPVPAEASPAAAYAEAGYTDEAHLTLNLI